MKRRIALSGDPAAMMMLSARRGMRGGSYGLEPGDAAYDVLRAATETYQSRGGAISPRKGAEGRDLAGYQCVIGRVR